MPKAGADTLIATFESDLSLGKTGTGNDIMVVWLGQGVLDEAVSILDRHPLNAADASQLATARLTRRLISDLTNFLCFDKTLRIAAAAEGFVLQPA